MRFVQVFGIAVLLTGVAGCKKGAPADSPTTESSNPGTSPPSYDAASSGDVESPAPDASPAPPSPVAVDASVESPKPDAGPVIAPGVAAGIKHPLAKLSPGLLADKKHLQNLVPAGFRVEQTDSAIEEGMRPIELFLFNRGKKQWAEARGEKGRLFEVRFFDSGFRVPGVGLAPGKRLPVKNFIDCGCQGEDGSDGFVCRFKRTPFQAVVETREGDCGLLEPAATRAAVKGRIIVSLRLSNE